jgi:adenylate cyclase class 2
MVVPLDYTDARMAREVEIKFRLRERAAPERKLRALGATYVGTVEEQNTLFDREDRALVLDDRALRVRIARSLEGEVPSRATLTWKGPRSEGPLKDREEHETEIASPAAMVAILAELGLRPVLHFEKRRSTWHLGEAEVVIDEIEGLGTFLEIEAGAAAIEAAIVALELRDPALGAEVEPRSYPELWRERSI